MPATRCCALPQAPIPGDERSDRKLGLRHPYAIVWVNLLTDTSQTPHMQMTDLCAHFGVRAGAGAAKSAEIRRPFKLRQLDPAWYRPSKLADNFTAWTISVNGMIVDARYAPRDIQEEAARRGLIPYLPPSAADDRDPS